MCIAVSFTRTVLVLGSKGSTVRQLQRHLGLRFEEFEMADVMSVRIDGVLGTETLTAVKYWQCVGGLPVTGRVDEATWRFVTQGVEGLPMLSLGVRRTCVRAVQKAVLESGISVPMDGVFGLQTVAAVKAYQEAMGLNASGVVGADTWTEIVRSRLTTLPCAALLPRLY